MSIETMKKEELIKQVRTLTQELKLSEARVAELESATQVAEKSPIEANTESEEVTTQLPYVAVSIIKHGNDDHRVYQVRFDLDGNAKLDPTVTKVTKEGYRAGYEAAKLMETTVATQEAPQENTVTKEA